MKRGYRRVGCDPAKEKEAILMHMVVLNPGMLFSLKGKGELLAVAFKPCCQGDSPVLYCPFAA